MLAAGGCQHANNSQLITEDHPRAQFRLQCPVIPTSMSLPRRVAVRLRPEQVAKLRLWVKAASASSDVGTLLYSAPEVATGRYDEKCDIYSLGIVLIELFAGFNTGMERIKVLTKIREDGEISEDLGLDSTVLELARCMTNHKVECRPSAGDILEYLMKNNLPISPDTDTLLHLVERLERKCSEKDGEIKRLRELSDANGISF